MMKRLRLFFDLHLEARDIIIGRLKVGIIFNGESVIGVLIKVGSGLTAQMMKIVLSESQM
ncbi:hypothetical protein QJS04_geneDACA018940 [Acorus gramineus]|uniref:Uncharacterized protein n=1 Tax=Acorus gramineus TaxID=55184 RepID=A0AAV9ABK2_ACOGR|nr:hypothetical protein QJS04_geneDACA018940 [Acorus gramineus]